MGGCAGYVIVRGDVYRFVSSAEWGNGRYPPTPIRVVHFAFRADYPNFEAAQQSLTAKGIAFQFQDHDISHSIYFSDPDGHRLEITTYDLPQKP